MIENDDNLDTQIIETPPEQEESSESVIEPDELDVLISEALDGDEDEDEDNEDENEEGESGEDSEDPDDSSSAPPPPPLKKKGRSALRRAKEAIRREQLRKELEQERREKEAARALAEQERSRAYGMEALIKTISGGASMDEILGVATGTQQPELQQEAPLTQAKMEEWFQRRTALGNEMTSLQNAWRPIHQRVVKTAPHVASWFDGEFTANIEANPARRDLLKATAAFSYPMEALYAASKTKGFENLSVGDQVALTYKINAKIADRNNKQQTSQSQKREILKTPSSSSVKARVPPEKRSNEDWFNEMYGNR